MSRKLLALPFAAVLALTGAACGDDDDSVADQIEGTVDDVTDDVEDTADDAAQAAAETAARNIAAERGDDHFEAAGYDIDGDLTCEADASGGTDAVEITCTGTTEDGEDAELTGTTSETPGASATALEGDFTGTVAGDEVFTTDRLGEVDDDNGDDDDDDDDDDSRRSDEVPGDTAP